MSNDSRANKAETHRCQFGCVEREQEVQGNPWHACLRYAESAPRTLMPLSNFERDEITNRMLTVQFGSQPPIIGFAPH